MPKSKSRLFLITTASIVLSILVIGILLVIFVPPQQQTGYFYDEDLGVITQKITIYDWWNKWMKIFQQAITFSPTEINIGDSVTLDDEYTIITLTDSGDSGTICAINDVNMKIISPSSITTSVGGSGFIDPPISDIFQVITYSTTYTPDEVGVWSGTTTYSEGECDLFGLNCMSTPNCPGFYESSTNSVTVLDTTPDPCTEIAYWSDWVSHDVISNGVINIRIHYSVDDDCNYYSDNTEYQTVCDTGYQIEGTSGSTIGAGQLTCELITTPPECDIDDDCTSQICENEVCVDYECADDLEINCDDNSTVTTHTCTNNRLIETGNECPITTTTNDTTFNDTTPSNITIIDRQRIPSPADSDYSILIIIASISVLLITIIIFIIYKKKRRKK